MEGMCYDEKEWTKNSQCRVIDERNRGTRDHDKFTVDCRLRQVLQSMVHAHSRVVNRFGVIQGLC